MLLSDSVQGCLTEEPLIYVMKTFKLALIKYNTSIRKQLPGQKK